MLNITLLNMLLPGNVICCFSNIAIEDTRYFEDY